MKIAQKLAQKARKLYEQYDVKKHIALVQDMEQQDSKITDLNQAEDVAHNLQTKYHQHSAAYEQSDIIQKRHSVENAQQQTQSRTLMAQYLREKAFKTEASRLSFKQYAEKYATLFEVETKEIPNLVIEMERTHGRKL